MPTTDMKTTAAGLVFFVSTVAMLFFGKPLPADTVEHGTNILTQLLMLVQACSAAWGFWQASDKKVVK